MKVKITEILLDLTPKEDRIINGDMTQKLKNFGHAKHCSGLKRTVIVVTGHG